MLPIENCDAKEPEELSVARRTALLQIAGLCGLALSGNAMAALVAPKGKAHLLTPDQLKLTGVLAELIIPATSTPGALAVGAHHTIDHMLAVCYSKETQQQFVAGLERIDTVATSSAGKRFTALPATRQVALLRALDAASAPFNADDKQFFKMLKGQTLFAYYTSEAGSTRELAYLPMPGGFKGNVPLAKQPRTWAL